MRQHVRFCTARDGVRLAYAVHGSGPPLVRVATWLSHLELDWESPVWRHWHQRLGERHTLLRYDERGCGLSDTNIGDPSVDVWVGDLECSARFSSRMARLRNWPRTRICSGAPPLPRLRPGYTVRAAA